MPLTEREVTMIFDTLKQVDKKVDDMQNEITKHTAWEEAYHPEHTKLLNQVLEQTKKTNGRVTDLEIWRANVQGKIIGISMVISTVIGFIAWFLK